MAATDSQKSAVNIGATATGTVLGGPAIGAASSQAASSLCDCCCGNAAKGADQKAAIAQQQPLTGNASVDAQIQANRDAEYKKWQNMQDLKSFQTLPKDTQALLPGLKSFADQIFAQLPAADKNLTLAQAYAKYPDMAKAVYEKMQQVMPSLKNMPIEYAMALAKASGADQIKLSEIKDRIDYVATNSGVTSASTLNLKAAGLVGAGAAVLVGAIAFLKRK